MKKMSMKVQVLSDAANQLLLDAGVSQSIIDYSVEQYRKNDLGHNVDHLDTVVLECAYYIKSLRTSSQLNKTQLRAIYLGACLHDIQHHVDSENHHLVAGDWFLENVEMFKDICPRVRALAYLAILEHRASAGLEPSTIVSKIVAAADRGQLSHSEALRRSYLFAYTKYNDHIAAREHALKKISEKYGDGGYVYKNLPSMVKIRYHDEIPFIKEDCDNLVKGRRLIDSMHKTWLNNYLC